MLLEVGGEVLGGSPERQSAGRGADSASQLGEGEERSGAGGWAAEGGEASQGAAAGELGARQGGCAQRCRGTEVSGLGRELLLAGAGMLWVLRTLWVPR